MELNAGEPTDSSVQAVATNKCLVKEAVLVSSIPFRGMRVPKLGRLLICRLPKLPFDSQKIKVDPYVPGEREEIRKCLVARIPL